MRTPLRAKAHIGKTLSLLLGLCLLAAFAPPAALAAEGERDEFARRFLARYVTTLLNTGNNSFPGDEANAVLQTGDGYLWFGGYNGLYRFDGAAFTTWDAATPNGFNSSNIRSLFEGGDGTLWIGTNDRGLVAYRNGAFTAYGKAAGAPSNTIRTIAEGPGGHIYCGTPDGIFRIDGEGRIETVTLDTPIHPFVISLCFDARGSLYAVLNTGELFVYTSDGRTVRCPHEEPIDAATAVSGNRIVAGGRDGTALFLQFDGARFTRSEKKATPIQEPTAVYEDSGGRIWLTGEPGLGFFDKDEEYHHAGDPSGVGFYTDIREDYQHNYWIAGSKGGVVKLTVSAFLDVNALLHTETGAVNAVVLQSGDTYIGTDDGLMILGPDGTPVRTDFSEKIDARVRGVFEDSAGDIWVCTYSDFGVIRYSPASDSWENWLPADGLVSEKTRCALELPNGVMVVGTAGGVSFIRDGRVVAAAEALETEAELDLPDIMVLSLAYASGTLYIGTDGGGVYAVGKEGTTRYREEDGLTGGVVLRMLSDPKGGGVWVAASPGLCYIGADGKVAVIDKVPPDTFLDIMRYNDELVLLTSSLIIRTNERALLDPELPFTHTAVGKTSGLTASISANAWNLITDRGDLYFCRDNGISVYSFEKKPDSFIPYVGITKIDVDGREHTNFSRRIVISRDADRLTAELSYLSYGLTDDAALRYTLVGQDTEEHTLRTDGPRTVSYTNLKGGRYILRVWAEGSSGQRGNTVEVRLRKELRLFEYSYVWVSLAILGALLLSLIVAAFFRHKNRRFYEKQREYRAIIAQALDAITRAIDAKDTYTRGHSSRVAAYSVKIARQMGMDRDFLENLYYIGLLHDVGKIGIPNSIINKPDSLTPDEYEVMKQHPGIGREILKDITTIRSLTSGVGEHHERWDGNGYGQGIVGENISLEARIIAVADTYDAMSSDRPYRKGLSREDILAEFRACSGSQFDPKIAEIATDLIERDGMSAADVNEVIDLINEGRA